MSTHTQAWFERSTADIERAETLLPKLAEALRDLVTQWDALTIEPVPDSLNQPELWDAARAALAEYDKEQT